MNPCSRHEMYFNCTDAARSGLDLLSVWLSEPSLCSSLCSGDWGHSRGRQAKDKYRDKVPREVLRLVLIIYCRDPHAKSKYLLCVAFIFVLYRLFLFVSMLFALLQIIVILLWCQQALDIIRVAHVTPVNFNPLTPSKELYVNITWIAIRPWVGFGWSELGRSRPPRSSRSPSPPRGWTYRWRTSRTPAHRTPNNYSCW